MPDYRVFITTRAASNLNARAQDLRVTPEHLLSLTVEEIFGNDSGIEGLGQPVSIPDRLGGIAQREPEVSKWFPGYPVRSVTLAQKFVNRAVQLPNVSAFKQGRRGIALRPRFAQIEYLLSFRAEKPGIVASLYGAPTQFADTGGLLEPDRKSYSRARIYDEDSLNRFMDFAEQSYFRRYGRANEEP